MCAISNSENAWLHRGAISNCCDHLKNLTCILKFWHIQFLKTKKSYSPACFSQVIYFECSISVSDNQLGHFLCKDSQLCTAISLLLAQNFKQFMFAYSSDPFSNFQTNSQVVERLMALNHSVESSKSFFQKLTLQTNPNQKFISRYTDPTMG